MERIYSSFSLLVVWTIASAGTRQQSVMRSEDAFAARVAPFLAIPGVWPFNDTRRTCDVTATLDTHYDPALAGENVPRIQGCGLNRFSAKEELEPANIETEFHNLQELLRKYLASRRLHGSKSDVDEVDMFRREGEKLQSRIVGGEQVEEGQWPWLAAVGPTRLGPRCGGTLIGAQWVLTAAHCFRDLERACDYNVRLGAVNWAIDSSQTHVDRIVTSIHRHPHYDSRSQANDVALLKLSSPVKLDASSHVNAICFPQGARSADPGTFCLAAGWGLGGEDHPKKMQTRARQVQLPIIAYEEGRCGNYAPHMVLRGMLCAGYSEGGRDTCQGDSGGPLVYRRSGRWTQLGLTSFGVGCARADSPGVYTDVGQFLPWIASVMRRYA